MTSDVLVFFFFFSDPRVGFLWVFYRDFNGLPGWMDPLLEFFFKSGYMCHGRSVVAILGMGWEKSHL